MAAEIKHSTTGMVCHAIGSSTGADPTVPEAYDGVTGDALANSDSAIAVAALAVMVLPSGACSAQTLRSESSALSQLWPGDVVTERSCRVHLVGSAQANACSHSWSHSASRRWLCSSS